MQRHELVEKILDVKRDKDLTWEAIADAIGGYSKLFLITALLGQMPLPKREAEKAAALFDLTDSERKMLMEVPYRGESSLTPPTDPTLYRFFEAMMVFGPSMKEAIHEEFGDGIMSAIDFDLKLEREPNDAGDRVKITMNGKFLPYRYHSPRNGAPALGYKQKP
ncbi:cyanase [Rhizobium sp. SL86]|uniref:cyanase n=1 Tax=Rhizobium sp. SL86 TaxID=2995148 RepID=UPI00227364D4|nr:cyanase [Rhizobium sp. SL86]MCY1667803.1 cyanase [Rhizobium sp. SL86]